jgi:hypothetical protein
MSQGVVRHDPRQVAMAQDAKAPSYQGGPPSGDDMSKGNMSKGSVSKKT